MPTRFSSTSTSRDQDGADDNTAARVMRKCEGTQRMLWMDAGEVAVDVQYAVSLRELVDQTCDHVELAPVFAPRQQFLLTL